MAGTPTPPSRGRKIAWRIARFFIVFYVLIVMVFYALQTTLIFPGSWKQGTEGSRISQPPEGAKLVDLETAGAQPVKALFARALRADGTLWPETDRRPTILYFYGNGMQLAAALVQIEDMRRLGANVMVADYVGYGLSGGKPSEQGCYDTATAEYRWLVANPQVDGRKIISAGWSLGAAVAADLASRERVAGLMMFSAFTSMADAASWNYPWLPIRPLLKHRFESLAKISGVHCPILLAHGRQDTLVPFDMSERLAKAAGGPVEQVAIADGGHNDFWPSGHESVLAAMSRMVEKVAAE